MKQRFLHFVIPAIFSSFLFSCTEEKKIVPVLNSTHQKLKLYINNEISQGGWTISPEINPDRLEVECVNERNTVSFTSDIDSISFNIKLNDTIRFIVLLNGKDSAFTEIVGIPKNANFSDEYIRQHKGLFSVEIPEVHELANILIALCKVGQLDSNMVDMTTAYYRDVITHFMEKQMTHQRNFIRFKEFNQQLVNLYMRHPTISMPDLYDMIIEWSLNFKENAV